VSRTKEKHTTAALVSALKEADWLNTRMYGRFTTEDNDGILYTCQPHRESDGRFRIAVGIQYGIVGGEYCSGSIEISADGRKVIAYPEWVNQALPLILIDKIPVNRNALEEING